MHLFWLQVISDYGVCDHYLWYIALMHDHPNCSSIILTEIPTTAIYHCAMGTSTSVLTDTITRNLPTIDGSHLDVNKLVRNALVFFTFFLGTLIFSRCYLCGCQPWSMLPISPLLLYFTHTYIPLARSYNLCFGRTTIHQMEVRIPIDYTDTSLLSAKGTNAITKDDR